MINFEFFFHHKLSVFMKLVIIKVNLKSSSKIIVKFPHFKDIIQLYILILNIFPFIIYSVWKNIMKKGK